MEERSEKSPIDGTTPMRPSVASAVREMSSRAPMMAANGIFRHPSECTQEEQNFIADCLKKNIPLYVIAGMIHCEKQFLSRYIRNHPDLLALKDEQSDNIVDEAEYQLDRLNRAGNASTIIFTLQTKGRKRGWTTEDLPEGGGGEKVERIVMGVIPDEAVKDAEDRIEKARSEPLPNPGGVMTDPISVAAMEQMKKEVLEAVDEAVERSKPKAIEADDIEVGGPSYSDDSRYGAMGFGVSNPSMEGADPWATGADSPFFQ